MTMIEKKIRTLGATGGVMYLTAAHLRAMKKKFPTAKITRIEDPAPMVEGFHAYVVENWKELSL